MGKNIIEKLENRGMDENVIKKFIGKIAKAYKQKKLDKLTNDKEYQSILKKYNLKPIDWGKEPDAKSYDQHQKNVAKLKKLGLR